VDRGAEQLLLNPVGIGGTPTVPNERRNLPYEKS